MKVSSILFLIGGILVVIAFVVPFLMMMEIVPKILWLEMALYIMSFVGLGMGIMGSVIHVKNNRDKNKRY